MLTHLVCFKFKDPNPEVLSESARRLVALVGQVPSLRSLDCGVDVLHTDRSFDLGLVATFDDVDGLKSYQVDPIHQEVVAYLKPLVEKSVCVDFDR